MEKQQINNEIVKVDNEYGELLQRCVAVIEQARTAIAKIMNTTSMTAYAGKSLLISETLSTL